MKSVLFTVCLKSDIINRYKKCYIGAENSSFKGIYLCSISKSLFISSYIHLQ